jgi:hypothetical protein
MSTGTTDFEALLREALSPVDPPEDLVARLETTLVSLTELAQDELESWELTAMRDPRNWVRPAAAVVARHRVRKQQSRNVLELAEQTLRDVADEARRILPDR